MEIFYKVVRKVAEGEFVSAMTTQLPPYYNLRYTMGEITKKAVDSIGIFTFNDLQSAKSFALDYDWSKILVGEGKKCRKQSQWYCTNTHKLFNYYRYYLSGQPMNKYAHSDYLVDSYDNVILLDFFKPVRIVQPTHVY
jgi:hypothetical protein